jgi:hypothetical protein
MATWPAAQEEDSATVGESPPAGTSAAVLMPEPDAGRVEPAGDAPSMQPEVDGQLSFPAALPADAGVPATTVEPSSDPKSTHEPPSGNAPATGTAGQLPEEGQEGGLF